MNENTLVVVRAHGDAQPRVRESFRSWTHHGCHVVVMSPIDSPVTLIEENLSCLQIGQAAYFGHLMLERLRLELTWMSQQPYEYFLVHEWDSFCLSPEIPKICYSETYKDSIWFNEVRDPRPHESPYPKIALHAPWFLSKGAIIKMLSVAERIPMHPITPFSDWYALAMAFESGLLAVPWAALEIGGTTNAETVDGHERIRNRGWCMVHPIKEQSVLNQHLEENRSYRSEHPESYKFYR